jgi:hypothetical protein
MPIFFLQVRSHASKSEAMRVWCLRISSAAARVRSLAEGRIAGGERKCEPTPKPLNKFLARAAPLFYVCSCSRPVGGRRAGRRCFEPMRFGRRDLGRETLRTTRSRREMAPQPLEKIESAPGNGMVSTACNLQDVVHERAVDPARLPLASREVWNHGPRETDGNTESAGKWRRNRLKRLNPRPEMVGSWKPLTYKIWYTRAADRARLRLTRMGRR